jgi:uncharacterized protein YecE (DUF72 family)
MTAKKTEQLALGLPSPIRPRFAELTALAEKVPKNVRFGTSSWTFPGWRGSIYFERYTSDRAFTQDSLAEYARFPLFRTVGIDRSYYAPIPEPDLVTYARQMPEDFVPIAKVWSEVTTPVFPKHPRYGERGGERNMRFLDPVLFDEQMGDPFTRTIGDARIPFVLEVPPSSIELVPFTKALDAFLGAQAGKHRFAVEIRNTSLLAPRYFDVLRAHGATHVFNYWERMPELDVQYNAARPVRGGFMVIRLLIPPGQRYEDQKAAFAPFDRIVTAQPIMRRHVIRLVQIATELGQEVFVIVNNKAEGCSPLTVEALVRQLTGIL